MTDEQLHIIRHWCDNQVELPMTEHEGGLEWISSQSAGFTCHTVKFLDYTSTGDPRIQFIGYRDGEPYSLRLFFTTTQNAAWNLNDNMEFFEAVWDKLNRKK